MFNLTSSIPVVHSPTDQSGWDKHSTTTGHEGDKLPSSGPNDRDKDAVDDDIESHTPIYQNFLAGGLGGVIGDSAMHSLDTVKTRQQGSPNVMKYRHMLSAYRTIFVEEGVMRGLYGGYFAAMAGSFPSAAIFFSTYEYSKRTMINDYNINETTAFLASGFLGDLASSIAYVPSEVLKTRLQLQGRYNNTFFDSGYNYKHLRDAIRTIFQTEGMGAFFFGYRATLARDLPFSALQFAFYEKFRQWAYRFENKNNSDSLSIPNEILTGASAGGLAGIITTPLDVVKTRVQTQHTNTFNNKIIDLNANISAQKVSQLSNSILQSLKILFKAEGIVGCFSGVGPRFIWTSVQSSIMLLFYQMLLRKLGSSMYKNNEMQ